MLSISFISIHFQIICGKLRNRSVCATWYNFKTHVLLFLRKQSCRHQIWKIISDRRANPKQGKRDWIQDLVMQNSSSIPVVSSNIFYALHFRAKQINPHRYLECMTRSARQQKKKKKKKKIQADTWQNSTAQVLGFHIHSLFSKRNVTVRGQLLVMPHSTCTPTPPPSCLLK